MTAKLPHLLELANHKGSSLHPLWLTYEESDELMDITRFLNELTVADEPTIHLHYSDVDNPANPNETYDHLDRAGNGFILVD